MKNDKVRKLYDKISTMEEYELLYYDEKCHDKLVGLLIKFKKLGLYLPKEMFELIVHGRIINNDVTPISYARKELNKLEAWSPKAKILARKARLHWGELSDRFVTQITTNGEKAEMLEVSEPNIRRKL